MKFKDGKIYCKIGIEVIVSLFLISSSMFNSAKVDTSVEDYFGLTNTSFEAINIDDDLDFGPS